MVYAVGLLERLSNKKERNIEKHHCNSLDLGVHVQINNIVRTTQRRAKEFLNAIVVERFFAVIVTSSRDFINLSFTQLTTWCDGHAKNFYVSSNPGEKLRVASFW